MHLIDAALAALPILVVLVLLVLARRSAALAGAAGLLTSLVLAVVYFDPSTPELPGLIRPLVGAGVEAASIAGTILWIIFGALCIYQLQQRTGAIGQLRAALGGLSDDPRIVVILVAWFFALFTEGAAGFGTAVALSAPFLVGFGFKPVDAVVITLIGHGVGVSFGAVGIPTLAQVAFVPFSGQELAHATAPFHALLGWMMLVWMLRAARRFDGPKGNQQEAVDAATTIVGWAGLAAACYLVPMYLIARFVGPELPTLGGSLVGGIVFVGIYRFFGSRSQPRKESQADDILGAGPILRASAPYIAVIVLVLLTRLITPIHDALGALSWSWTLWGSFEGNFDPLLHPGTMLFASFLVGAIVQRASLGQVRDSVVTALAQLVPVALALLAMLALSRVMAHAGMVDALAVFAASAAGGAWPFFAPWIGLLGTFITGSATASNILFSEFQLATSTRLSLPALSVLGAQNAGSAVGSIVAPSKIIAGGATVGIAGQEGTILRRTIGPCLVFITLTGLLTLLQVYLLS
jgi:lactate permease